MHTERLLTEQISMSMQRNAFYRGCWQQVSVGRELEGDALSGVCRICICLARSSASEFLPVTVSPLTSTTMPSARVLRDIKARHGVQASEIARRAYLMVARNETLSPQVRHHAQLQLNTFGRYTRPTTVKNRCTESGKGRGIISEFGLSRVCTQSRSTRRF